MKNSLYLPSSLAILLSVATGCDSSARSKEGNNSYVSMGQLFQANSAGRALTAHERSYLLGSAHGVFSYVAYQQLKGLSEHVHVCATPIQMDSVTPEWLYKTMIQDATENSLWSTQDSTDAAITAANTLAKHFPCRNAPKYNPEGFDDAMDFIQQNSGSSSASKR
jgi:hypothetical protein